jgi:hypothetical protein
MSIFSRIGDFFRMIFSIFLEGAEDSVPLERRLAYDRLKRAENLKKQMGAAEDVGAAAEMMVQQLAEARIVAANLRQEAKAHLQAASAAAARGDVVTQQQEEARATALAEELAVAEDEVLTLELMVEEALYDKQEAIDMVLDQSKQLEKLARGDSRLVARARMTEMRRQQLELREQMMELVPGDQTNMRARIQESVDKDEARFRARRDVVDAMWKQKQTVSSRQALTTTAAGAAVLEELKNEVGYSSAPPPLEAPAEAPAETPVEAEEGEEAKEAEAGGSE